MTNPGTHCLSFSQVSSIWTAAPCPQLMTPAHFTSWDIFGLENVSWVGKIARIRTSTRVPVESTH